MYIVLCLSRNQPAIVIHYLVIIHALLEPVPNSVNIFSNIWTLVCNYYFMSSETNYFIHLFTFLMNYGNYINSYLQNTM